MDKLDGHRLELSIAVPGGAKQQIKSHLDASRKLARGFSRPQKLRHQLQPYASVGWLTLVFWLGVRLAYLAQTNSHSSGYEQLD